MRPFRFTHFEREYIESRVRQGQTPQIGKNQGNAKAELRDKIEQGEYENDLFNTPLAKKQLNLFDESEV